MSIKPENLETFIVNTTISPRISYEEGDKLLTENISVDVVGKRLETLLVSYDGSGKKITTKTLKVYTYSFNVPTTYIGNSKLNTKYSNESITSPKELRELFFQTFPRLKPSEEIFSSSSTQSTELSVIETRPLLPSTQTAPFLLPSLPIPPENFVNTTFKLNINDKNGALLPPIEVHVTAIEEDTNSGLPVYRYAFKVPDFISKDPISIATKEKQTGRLDLLA